MFKKKDLHAIFIYLTLTKCTNFVVLLCCVNVRFIMTSYSRLIYCSLGVVALGLFGV